MISLHIAQLHPILQELVEAGVEVHLTKTGYQLHGINKCGSVTLTPTSTLDASFCLTNDRYPNEGSIPVSGISDVLDPVYDWWQGKPECGDLPDGWAKLLHEYGYIRREQKTVTVITPLR